MVVIKQAYRMRPASDIDLAQAELCGDAAEHRLVRNRTGIHTLYAAFSAERFSMVKKTSVGGHDAGAAAKNAEPGPKDQKAPAKQIHPPGNQERHGGGEGLTGMQPGAGHPRGR